MKLLLWLCIAGNLGFSRAEYPSSFPFDIETHIAELPETTPSYTFDNSDPGGYLRKGLFCDLNDATFAPLFESGTMLPIFHCGTWSNYFQVVMSVMHDSDYIGSNCSTYPTVTPAVLSEMAYEGLDDVPTCSKFLGAQPLVQGGWSRFSDNQVIASCAQPNEPELCLTATWLINFCATEYISPSLRLTVLPCADTYIRFFVESCNVVVPFSSTGVETETFYNSLSTLGTIVLSGFSINSDRVCLPYSYFNPADESTDSSTDESTDSSSSATSLFVSAGVIVLCLSHVLA